MEDDGIVDVRIDRELKVELKLNKGKWNKIFIMLCGGVVCWRKRESDETIRGHVFLTNAEITPMKYKNRKYVLKLQANDETPVYIDFDDETEREEWTEECKKKRDDPPSFETSKERKRVGRMMRLKKNLGGKIATSAAGKSLIKDMLGPTTITVINILKELIESKDGKKKANEIENIAIKIGVKIILLYNNKNIPDRDLRKGLPFIKKFGATL